MVDVALFVFITYGFHKIWWAFDDVILNTAMYHVGAKWLSTTIYGASAWIDAHLLAMNIVLQPLNTIHFNYNNTAISVVDSCSGFKQMWQVLVLFLIIPGPWKSKLWYIPVGLVTIFFVNILRIVGLSVAMLYWPENWDFIHLWVFRPLYYVAIFVLWVIWVEKFGGMKKFMMKE